MFFRLRKNILIRNRKNENDCLTWAKWHSRQEQANPASLVTFQFLEQLNLNSWTPWTLPSARFPWTLPWARFPSKTPWPTKTGDNQLASIRSSSHFSLLRQWGIQHVDVWEDDGGGFQKSFPRGIGAGALGRVGQLVTARLRGRT